MKGVAVFLVLLTLAIGTYLFGKDMNDSQVMIEDVVESSLAAPVKADLLQTN
jgi:hypothetical protein